MQQLYKTTEPTTLALCCEPDDEVAANDEPVVVLALVVPGAAEVSALRQPVSTALRLTSAVAITSTVPAKVYVQLRASNTAQGAAWCITATLAASPALRARA
jgi:hypothetical protein